MTAPTASIRSTVKRALVTVIRAQAGVAGVTVSYAPPIDGMEDRHIFLGDVQGSISYPTTRATRFQRDDKFTIDVWIRAHVPGDETGEDADEQVEALLGALDDVLSDVADALDVDGVVMAELGDIEGPMPMRTEEGHESWFQVEVSVHARLS